jgi:AP-4 complex subunit sigma-1
MPKCRELRVDEDATEIAIISPFDLLFQSLRDYFGDISEFPILCRMVALNEIIETSKGKIIRTLDSVFV